MKSVLSNRKKISLTQTHLKETRIFLSLLVQRVQDDDKAMQSSRIVAHGKYADSGGLARQPTQMQWTTYVY
jgi:hypothetical protein